MNTKLKSSLKFGDFSILNIPNTKVALMADSGFPLCSEALRNYGTLYTELSDWFAVFCFINGLKTLVALLCVNDSYRTEFKTEYPNSLHLSKIEVKEPFRDSNLKEKLHIFSNSVEFLEYIAKEAGYNYITLQAIDLSVAPKYEHVGYSKIDHSKFFKNEQLDFYTAHPFYVKRL